MQIGSHLRIKSTFSAFRVFSELELIWAWMCVAPLLLAQAFFSWSAKQSYKLCLTNINWPPHVRFSLFSMNVVTRFIFEGRSYRMNPVTHNSYLIYLPSWYLDWPWLPPFKEELNNACWSISILRAILLKDITWSVLGEYMHYNFKLFNILSIAFF